MSARWPSWISSLTTSCRIRSASRCLGRRKRAALRFANHNVKFPIATRARRRPLRRYRPYKEHLMRYFFGLIVAVTCALSANAACAHAFLDHAVPGVGATVSGSPSELKLTFTESLMPAFSGVKIATADGAPVPAGKATR